MKRSDFPKTFHTEDELTTFAASHGLSIRRGQISGKTLADGELTVHYQWTSQGDTRHRYNRDDSR